MFNKKRIFVFFCFILLLFFLMTFGSSGRNAKSFRVVTFIDGFNDTVIKRVEIETGTSTDKPETPIHEGCDFTGWYDEDNEEVSDFSNVTKDITVYAMCDWQYFNVVFYDTVDRNTIKTERVRYGLDATAPRVPTHVNYTFDGWSRGYTNVREDIRVDALYSTQTIANYFNVRFYDDDTKELIKTESVREGLSATFPSIPVHKNRVYDRYEGDYTNVTEDRIVTLFFKDAVKYNVTFNKGEFGFLNTDKDKVVFSVFENNTFSEGKVFAPVVNPIIGYKFDRWDINFTDDTVVTSDLEFTALYTANTNTVYNVEHYLESTTSGEYSTNPDYVDNMVGTTNTETEAAAKTINGFTAVLPIVQQLIKGDGSTVIKIYYTRNSYNVYLEKDNYISSVNGDGSYKFGQKVDVLAELGKEAGYTYSFTNWTEKDKEVSKDTAYSFNMPDHDVTLKANGSRIANSDTAYVVKYYTQDLDKENNTLLNTYTLVDTVNKTGTTDTEAVYDTKTYDGFTKDVVKYLDGTKEVSVNTINGKGTTIVEVYYTRNTNTKYLVQYLQEVLKPSVTGYKYADSSYVVVAENNSTGITGGEATYDSKSYVGFEFDKTIYYRDSAIESNETTDTTISATGNTIVRVFYSRNNDTAYKVNHYTVDGENVVLYKSIDMTGRTAEEVTANPIAITGYTYNSNDSRNFTKANIIADGSLVLKLYYSINNYSVTYKVDNNVFGDVEHYDFGKTVTVRNNPTKDGYTFGGWFTSDVSDLGTSFKMPAKNVTINGRFVANTDTKYIVEYYLQNLELNGYDLKETVNKTGTTDTEAIFESKNYDGFTKSDVKYYSGDAVVSTNTINGNGSTIVKVYYTRDTGTKYKVQYYLENLDKNDYILKETVESAGLTGAEATYDTTRVYDGFTKDKVEYYHNNDKVDTKTINGDGKTIVKVFYTRDTDTAYIVEHYLQNLSLDGYDYKETDNMTGTTGKEATFEKNSYDGFTYSSVDYYHNIDITDDKTINGDGKTVVKVYYTRNTRTAYKVEYYLENLNDNNYTKDKEVLSYGVTGAFPEYIVDKYTGFTYKEVKFYEGTKLTTLKTINGNGSTIVKIYYTRNSYTLTTVKGDNITNTTGDGTYKYGSEVTIDAILGNDAGYTYEFTKWNKVTDSEVEFTTTKNHTFTMPAEDLTVKAYATKTANENTAYKVEYYLEKLNSNEYDLKDTVNMTGTTDTEAVFESKTYTGFTKDKVEYYAGTTLVETNAINGNGSTIVKVYYTRNSYTLTTVKGDNITNTTGDGTYEFGAEVTINAILGNDAGYTYNFTKWNKVTDSEVEFTTTKNHTFTMPAEDLTVKAYASKTANTDTAYKVEYYLEKLNSDEYKLDTTFNASGVTGEEAVFENKTYVGFTKDKVEYYAGGTLVETNTINGDGSTIVKVYYTRNIYTLTTTGTDYITATYGSGRYEYETEVTINASLENLPGYTYNFIKWNKVADSEVEFTTTKNHTFTMPAEDLTLKAYASKTANSDTAYKVEYYLEKLNSNEYGLKDTVNMTGTTDTEAVFENKIYTGFTKGKVEYYAGTTLVEINTINGNGSTIVKIYYTRNSYTLTTVKGDNITNTTGDGTYKYGSEVTIDAILGNDAGYTYDFTKWNKVTDSEVEFTTTKNHTFTMPAEDLTLKAYATKTANENTVYKVEYYLEKLNSNEYDLKDTVNMTGTTDTEAVYDTKTYTGFTYSETKYYSNESVASDNLINGDGSTIVKVYYTRNSYTLTTILGDNIAETTGDGVYEYEESVTINASYENLAGYTYNFTKWNKVTDSEVAFTTTKNHTFTMPAEDLTVKAYATKTANTDTKYVVEYYTELLKSDGFELVETVNMTGTTDTEAVYDTKTYNGFTYSETKYYTNELVAGDKLIRGDGSTIVKVYFTRNSYTLTTVKGDNITNTTGDGTYEYEENVSIGAILGNDAGYTYDFDKWNKVTDSETEFIKTKFYSFTMPAEDLTLKAYASKTANTDTTYKVEYYLEKLNSDEYDLKETVNKTGTTDTEAVYDTKTYAGFTEDKVEYYAGTTLVETNTINGNGTTVVKVYYTRNSYTLTTVKGDNITNTTGDGTYEFGAEVTINATVGSENGYTFNFTKWNKVSSTETMFNATKNYTFNMPAEDLNLKAIASKTANKDTSYKVEYYLENLTANEYTLNKTVNKTGTTGELAAYESIIYTGFTYSKDEYYSGNVKADVNTINGNGSTIVKVYYTRNSYTLTTIKGDNITNTTGNGTYKYGAEVTIDAILGNDAGYTYSFTKWNKVTDSEVKYTTTKNYTFTMPAEDLTVKAYASKTANTNTAYKVEYYKDADTEPFRTDNKTATTGSTVNAEIITLTGYTEDTNNENRKVTGIVLGDGSLVLKVFYKKANYAFAVNKYYDGILDTDSIINSSAVYGSTVDPRDYATAVEGYKPPRFTPETLLEITEIASNNIINIYYVSKEAIITPTVTKNIVKKSGNTLDNIAEYGDTITYTLTLTNTGDAAGKITVKDVLFAAELNNTITLNSGYDEATLAKINALLSNGGYEITVGEAGSGNEVITITFNVTVTGYAGELINSNTEYKLENSSSYTSLDKKDINIEKIVNIVENSDLGANIVLVLDRSSSMIDPTATKFTDMKENAIKFVETVADGNTNVCIIMFPGDTAGNKTSAGEWAAVADDLGCSSNADTLISTINSITYKANGTPYTAALKSTITRLNSFSNTNNSYHVVFLSDGVANGVGDLVNRDYATLATRIKNCGVTIHTIAYAFPKEVTERDILRKYIASPGKAYVANQINIESVFASIAEDISRVSERTVSGLADIDNGIVTDSSIKFEVEGDSSKTVVFSTVDDAVAANYLTKDMSAAVHYRINTARTEDINYKGFGAGDKITVIYNAVSSANHGKTCSISSTITNQTSLSVSSNTVRIEKGKTTKITTNVYPNQSLTWTTEDSSIASVNNGVITGVSEGNTTIKVVTNDGQRFEYIDVEVYENHFLTSISLSETEIYMLKNNTYNLTVNYNPINANNIKEVKWYSSWDNRLSVDDGKLTSKNNTGNYTITVIVIDNDNHWYTATCLVHVVNSLPKVNVTTRSSMATPEVSSAPEVSNTIIIEEEIDEPEDKKSEVETIPEIIIPETKEEVIEEEVTDEPEDKEPEVETTPEIIIPETKEEVIEEEVTE